jgi:diacylglycerol O-acyltransferase / wax synthase
LKLPTTGATLDNPAVPNPDRLTGLDASFLHLERGGQAHMHVAEVLVFDGPPPGYVDQVAHVASRLDLVPRCRQRLAAVPLSQGRPVWIDDRHFNVRYHVRRTGLPCPGDDATLRQLAGRLFSQPLDRSKPLWELWLVDGLSDDRFALIGKTHDALADGVSGADITSALLDTRPNATAPPPPLPWVARPQPTPAQLLAGALLERARVPGEIARGVRRLSRAPRRAARAVGERLTELGAFAWAGLEPAPRTPYDVPIGPHRRYAWVDARLSENQAVGPAVMSYHGRLGLGLLGDLDALSDLDRLADVLRVSIAEPAHAAGVPDDGGRAAWSNRRTAAVTR